MKNAKKLLIILCAAALLSAMIFSLAVSAADDKVYVVSGEETKLGEYFDMNKVIDYGFEDGGGKTSALFAAIETQMNIVEANNIWKPATSVYTGDLSTYFMAADISKSTGNAYLQANVTSRPADNKPETTPANGFVYEFDIGFFSPVENVQEHVSDETLGLAYSAADGVAVYAKDDKYIDAEGRVAYVDTNGAVLYLADGGFLYKVNIRGNNVSENRQAYKTADGSHICYKAQNGNFTDIDGIPVDFDTSDITELTLADNLCTALAQADVTPLMEDVLEPLLDANGEPVIKNGVPVMVSKVKKLDYVPHTAKYAIHMLNTATQNDGVVHNLLIIDPTKESGELDIIANGAVVCTMSADEWIHLTFQYDADKFVLNVYVGRDDTEWEDGNRGRLLAGSYVPMSSSGVNVYPSQFRLATASTKGFIAYDNIMAYQGKTIHNPDEFQALSKDAQFEKLVSMLENKDGTVSAMNSFEAYKRIKSNYAEDYYDPATGVVNPSYSGNEKIVEAVELFKKYDTDEDGIMTELKTKVSTENTAEYIKYVKMIVDMPRYLGNINERKAKISETKNFLNSAGSNIDKSDEFYEYRQKLDALEKEAASDANTNTFVSHMMLFEKSVNYGASLNRLKNHYENAKAYYVLGITDFEDYDISTGDSNVRATYEKVKKYTEMYTGTATSQGAEQIIAANTREANSRRFIGLIGNLEKASSGDWSQDGAAVENLWLMAYDIIYENYYDATLPGMDEANAVFKSASSYFWSVLQQRHIEVLSERLADFGKTESYVDKAAVCTFVDRYIESNSRYIDYTLPELDGLIKLNEAYRAQLATAEVDYAQLLAQNTIEFVNTMKYTDNLEAYADLKPYYNKATEYYYTMNFKSDSVSEEELSFYIEKYELLRSQMVHTETSCDLFLATVNDLSAAESSADIYKLLAEGSTCLDSIDDTYAGISEAKAAFNAEYQKYVSSANEVNSQVEKTVNVACALRGNWDFDAIVAYFLGIFD